MKKLVYLLGLSLALILAACSGTDQNMPVAPQLEKGIADVNSFPYDIYQTFPELNSQDVSWHNEGDDLVIIVTDRSDLATKKYLFAAIEYANTKVATLAFLGDSERGKYFLNGLGQKEISNISVFFHQEKISAVDNNPPYMPGQLFNNLGVMRWSDGGTYVKVSSSRFPANMNSLFAQLIASEGNQLIFLGKPQSESFDFPKSENYKLKTIKLFTYQK